jgi:Predicted metal-dependent hydrolases related to alanyl-tRNA synthetase HxxxH domain
MTERIYTTDAYARSMEATIVGVDADESLVLLDRTVFYPGGGGQPCDVGTLWVGEDPLSVGEVRGHRDEVWHRIAGPLPPVGTVVRGELDWERRHLLMRTHTAMHALCGVVWSRFHSPVTGGNMRPGEGRLDFELPEWDPDHRQELEQDLDRALRRDLPVRVGFLPRAQADADPSLIRTKVSLLPPDLTEVRVIDIVGLDRQADGGTHVARTSEVGPVRIVKVESKGRGFRRIRLALDAPSAV